LSVTVSFRIPKELKKKMDELRGTINWSEEIRKFIERKIISIEQLKAINELEKLIESLPISPKGTGAKYVREDRDSY